MLRCVAVLACLGAMEAAFLQRQKAEPATLSLPLTDVLANGQQSFVGEVTVGTPGQSMSVVVDIAGITLFPSAKCTDPFCTSHQQYDSSASSTYEEIGTPFELPAGLNATGIISKDDIGVAGVTVQGQLFGEGTAIWNSWAEQAPNDGALGLGFNAAAPSILDGMADQGLIAERVAGLWLGRDGAGGELTLGGLKDDRYSGELTWSPIEDDTITAESVTIGDLSLCEDACLIGATSITPYFFMSMENAKAVNDALGGTDIGQPGVAALDCDTLGDLPTAKMVVAGRTLEMSSQEYTFFVPLGEGAQLCISGFVGTQLAIPADMMVGTLFMQKFFTVYDMDNMRVGIADSA